MFIKKSFETALAHLGEWRAENGSEPLWHLYKGTRIKHLLGLEPFSSGGVKIGGYTNMVNAASERHGPTWRMVVELGADEPKGWAVYPGSQTGNPGNPTYGQMIGEWASGDYPPLLFLRSLSADDERLIFTQTLKPENQ